MAAEATEEAKVAEICDEERPVFAKSSDQAFIAFHVPGGYIHVRRFSDPAGFQPDTHCASIDPSLLSDELKQSFPNGRIALLAGDGMDLDRLGKALCAAEDVHTGSYTRYTKHVVAWEDFAAIMRFADS